MIKLLLMRIGLTPWTLKIFNTHKADKYNSYTEGYGEVVTSPSGGFLKDTPADMGESSPKMGLCIWKYIL